MARVVMDPSKLAELLRSPSGPVMRRLIEDGEAVKDEARRLVRVHKPTPGERRKRRPGTVRDSINKRIVGPGVVMVQAADPISLIEHEGSSPHQIAPRKADRLVFWSGKAGRVVFMPKGRAVNHPGTTGSFFLKRALDVLRSRY